MSLAIPFVTRRDRKHRAVDKVAELRQENRKLLTRQMAADDHFAILMHDVTTTNAAWEQEKQLRGQAEEALAQMRMERDEWMNETLRLRAQLAPYKAAQANANRVTVPPMERIGADQPTAPQGIDVRPLWQARDAGHATTQ